MTAIKTEPILLVEDDAGVRETLTEILTDAGFDVVGCGSVAEVQRGAGAYGAALIDLKLPDGNGVEVAQLLRARQPDAELVFVTAAASVDTAIRAVNLGAVRYLQKPVHPDQVITLMREILERRALLREAAHQARRVEAMGALLRKLVGTLVVEDLATSGVEAILGVVEARGAAIAFCAGPNQGVYRSGVLSPELSAVVADTERVEALAWDAARGDFQSVGDAVCTCLRTAKDVPLACLFLEGIAENDDLELVRLMAGQLGVALQQASYHAELQTAYRQLSETHKTLVETEKQSAVGRLAAGIAHEIGTPLNIISGRAEVMLERVEPDGRIAKGLRTIHGQIDRITGLVRQLLDFSRADQDDKTSVRIAAVLAETLPLVETRAMRRRTTVVSRIVEADERPVRASFHQLQQVVLNLVLNSVDAGAPNIIIDAEVDESTRYLILTVTDDGEGIPEESLERVFEPFYTTKPRGEGTGLGLAVVRGIVRDHGGDIHAERVDGGGTRIVASIPLA